MNMHAAAARRGQIFVGMVLLIGSIIATVGLLLLFVSGSLINTSYGIKAATVAQAAASAGAEDAVLQFERNSFSSLPTTYTLSVNGVTATMNVAANTPSAGFATVTSTATYAAHTRVIRVILIATGTQMSVLSWQEVQ